MPSKRRPQAHRTRRPGARKTNRTKSSVARSTRTGKSRARRPSSLSARELKKRAAVLAAHSDMMRDRNVSAFRAAKNNGVTIRDYWEYIPKAFKKDSTGRIRAVADRYLRRMEIPGPDGPIVVRIRGFKAKTEMARFRNDFFSY